METVKIQNYILALVININVKFVKVFFFPEKLFQNFKWCLDITPANHIINNFGTYLIRIFFFSWKHSLNMKLHLYFMWRIFFFNSCEEYYYYLHIRHIINMLFYFRKNIWKQQNNLVQEDLCFLTFWQHKLSPLFCSSVSKLKI